MPLCNSVITLGKITVTRPTPLSLLVLASCFNNINLTVLILMHNGITIPRNLALHKRSGRCKILPTSKLNHLHHILVVIWKLAHYELVYLGALVWESSDSLSLSGRGFIRVLFSFRAGSAEVHGHSAPTGNELHSHGPAGKRELTWGGLCWSWQTCGSWGK